MSYQVLARKWRPRTFREMVGQEHVLKALINALDHDRLHHAYLFTGTRGVGKTTIARILAKCLNCDTGVSSEPCGQCISCNEINEGRFVDLIEVDAASRTKVEDTRELLDNVQYAPTQGRYKVYLIDEVHMLSTHSFNALLKTLEEPPPHVKFLLATTDPQKLPVTILSRCLQFNLKNMQPERIVGHLQMVLEQEMVTFEEPALWLLARAADGSMRDALSLTDQAIAFGNGKLVEADVSVMLGTIDQGKVFSVLNALTSGDPAQVFQVIQQLSEHSPDYAGVLNEMLNILHRVAVAQALPDAVDNSQGDREQVLALANALPAEDVQLYYQIGLHGRKDLPYAPEPRVGFEMAVLRMLAFKPEGVINPPTQPLGSGPGGNRGARPGASVGSPVGNPAGTSGGNQGGNAMQMQSPSTGSPLARQAIGAQPGGTQLGGPQAARQAVRALAGGNSSAAPVAASVVGSIAPSPLNQPQSAPQPAEPQQSQQQPLTVPPVAEKPVNRTGNVVPMPVNGAASNSTGVNPVSPKSVVPVAEPIAPQQKESRQQEQGQQPSQPAASVNRAARVVQTTVSRDLAQFQKEQWLLLVEGVGLSGLALNLAMNFGLEFIQGETFHFLIEQQKAALLNDSHKARIQAVLSEHFNTCINIDIQFGSPSVETPAVFRGRKKEERLAQAISDIEQDDNVKAMMAYFDGEIDYSSIKPIDSE